MARKTYSTRDHRHRQQDTPVLPKFCGKCGTEHDLELHGGQRVCRSCVVLEARRRADRVPR